MKLELGDPVTIKKCWIPADRDKQIEAQGINPYKLEEYLRTDEMAGDTVSINKFEKKIVDETGIIVGQRKIKTIYRLWHCYEDEYETGMGIMPEVDIICQESAEYETVYLVATRMNCIRKVSFEDMTYERV